MLFRALQQAAEHRHFRAKNAEKFNWFLITPTGMISRDYCSQD
jgi:hypothetical protein